YNIVLPNGDQRQVDLHGRHQHLPHTFRVLDLPHTVVLDVPQISMQRPGQQIVMEAHQLVADVDNRSDGVTQAHQLPFESIGLFQPDPPQIFLEQAGFQCLKALAEFAESQSIIIDNLVYQSVDDKAWAYGQLLRNALASCPDFGVARRDPVADRNQKVLAGEQVGLA